MYFIYMMCHLIANNISENLGRHRVK